MENLDRNNCVQAGTKLRLQCGRVGTVYRVEVLVFDRNCRSRRWGNEDRGFNYVGEECNYPKLLSDNLDYGWVDICVDGLDQPFQLHRKHFDKQIVEIIDVVEIPKLLPGQEIELINNLSAVDVVNRELPTPTNPLLPYMDYELSDEAQTANLANWADLVRKLPTKSDRGTVRRIDQHSGDVEILFHDGEKVLTLFPGQLYKLKQVP